MDDRVEHHCRPEPQIVKEIIAIARLLSGTWFTANVPEDTRKDLLFQDALCYRHAGRILSFLVFTSWDGSLHITLMGTHPEHRGKGYGSILLQRLVEHAASLGFERLVALTVPPEVNPHFQETLRFYAKHGFVLTKRYIELWEDGALELVKTLPAR